MNCEKFTRNQSGNILVHCNRSDPNRTYKNQEIHHDRTHWNYNLAPKHEGMTDYEFMKNRCEEFKILKRSNVNWMVSWVITIPADYEGSQEMFFKEAYNFMENKYGKENVISAYVHLDETSPHMHFCFVPVVFDTKKQEYKVNAKVCINRTELLKIHPQMQEYLENKLQTKVNILNGATVEGNKTVEQLKKEDKIKKAAIKELVKNPTEEIKNAVIEQLPEEQKETIVEQEIEIVKEELKKDPQFIQICKNRAMSELENIEELEIKIENLSTEKDYLEESMAELEIQHKKQRKELAEEYEREKRRNIERIRQMQNTTYEEQQKNPSFWDSLKERISKSKFISSLIIFKMELDKKIPIPQILSDLKYFSKRYDFYMEKPERALEQQEIFEHGYGITIYEHEQDTYGKNQEKEIEDDYNEIEP
jgi:hypothetical protein